MLGGFSSKSAERPWAKSLRRRWPTFISAIWMIKQDRATTAHRKITSGFWMTFFTWSGTAQQLRNFESFLNTIIPGITITLNTRHTCIEFLDTLIYKQFHNNGSATLNTKVYFKPTDTHQLLHADSAHPKHTVKGILKSQLIRFKRICSTYEEYNQASSDLFQILRLRGYSRSLYRELKYKIWHSNYSYNTDNTTQKHNNVTKSGR